MAEIRLSGSRAAPGFALGPIAQVVAVASARRDAGEPAHEAQALRTAIANARAALAELMPTLDADAADVLAFQDAMLDDATLSDPAFAAIARGSTADAAWHEALAAEIAGYEAADDEYFRARAADLRDLRDRVLAALRGDAGTAAIPRGAIVVADDLAPSRFLAIDWSDGGALVLASGSATSHVAMLARARGVPALVGVGADVLACAGDAFVDADADVIVVAPSAATRAHAHARRIAADAGRGARDAAARAPALSADGTRVAVMLNVADVSELDAVDPAICDGIGLVRTELLFDSAHGRPDVDTQTAAYRRLLEWAEGRPVTVRTLDAGGDKPIAGLTLDGESNPFLGVRGLRLSLAREDVFAVQLAALARAAAYGPLKVMLPMVTQPHELETARALFGRVVDTLRRDGVAAAMPALGIMVEVPAAAVTADLFDAAFYSIGSNDLAQYVAAAGRDVQALAPLASPTQPAMLRLITHVVAAATARGVDASLCGDAAGEPEHVGALLACGLRALSMAPSRVGEVKRAIAALDLTATPRDAGVR
ncbi:MAG: PEP-utilizing enzyme [Burkholderiales bacterium]|nr:PEP-utilizing enzyme [Burkholderiales bacterium]